MNFTNIALEDRYAEGFYSLPRMAVEANLLAFPVFLLSSTNPGRQGWFSYKRTLLHHPPNGEPHTVEQEWIVNGSYRWGLTRAVDLDICMALTEVAERRGGMPDDGVVWFSLYELKEILGWTRSGENYDLIRQSLERTAATTITSRKAFWSPRRANFISKTFSLWDPSLNYARDYEGRQSERHHVRFDELVVESYRDGYIERLDPSFYRSLKQSTAKRLYMLGDHYCAGEDDGHPNVWEIAPMELMEMMPLARYDRPKKVEEVLAKGHEELVHAGYFKDVEIERGKRNTPVLFRYKQSPEFARKRLGAEIERDPAGAMALAKLRKEKVNRAVAVELMNKFGASYCGRYADLLPFIPNVKPGEGAGLLVKAIRKGWDWEGRVARLPKGRGVSPVPGVPTDPRSSEGEVDRRLFSGAPEDVDVRGQPGEAGQHAPPDTDREQRLEGSPAADEPAPDTRAEAEEAWSGLVSQIAERHGPGTVSHWVHDVAAVSLRDGALGLEAHHGAAGTAMVNDVGEEILSLWMEQSHEEARLEVWSATSPETRIVLDHEGARKVTGTASDDSEED